jgi:peptidoglycan hydrolase-like protein with peptidoglycan-binding domain
MTPTSDRYREIQDALAAKGYLKSPSSGVWDADSIDAMQRFQKDHNLDPTGKLTARGLTALGLGTKQPDTTASLGATSEIESTPLQ